MRYAAKVKVLIMAASALLLSGPLLAQTSPSDLANLVAGRGDQVGDTQLEARGYRHIRTQTASDRKFSYWWNDRMGKCVSVSTYDGHYNAIVATLPADCGMRDTTGHDDHDAGYYGGMGLHLVCFGEGDKPSVQSVPIMHWNRRHHEMGTDYATVMSKRAFDGMVQINIHGGKGTSGSPSTSFRRFTRAVRMAGGN